MLSNGPLPAETYIPSNIPGPIRPGIGPGSWHVGPKIVREGRLPYGTYSARMARKDATMRTYGAPYGMDVEAAGVPVALTAASVGAALLLGGLFGGIAGAILPNTGFGKGAAVGVVSTGLTSALGFLLVTVFPTEKK